MQKVSIDSIEVRLSTEEEIGVGALMLLINPYSKQVNIMPAANLEVKFSKEEIEDLKKQVLEKIDEKFLAEMEVGTDETE